MTAKPHSLLVEDHSKLDNLFEEILVALRKRDYPCAFAALDYFWARLAMHIRAEHLHLFPALLETALLPSADDETQTANVPSIESVIEKLRVDHNFFMSELAWVMKTMRLILVYDNGGSLPDNLVEVAGRLENVGSRLKIHNDVEEGQVYPLVELSLLPNAAVRIHGKMKKELDNVPPRFLDAAETKDDTTCGNGYK